jgi:CheY-like chemotaxis protein
MSKPVSAVVLTKVPNVLIVEDEMLLRMRAVDIVEDAGFCPIEAINADEAISILETRSDISLLFTDIQMPGSMDGLKLARVVHERWPAIKIILVSGQVVPSDDEKPLDSRFFGKPLSMQRMVTEMQSIVSSSSESQVQPPSAQEAALSAENESLRLLLEQAGIDAKALLAQAGIEGARGRRQAAKAHSWRTTSSYQKYARDGQRYCISELSSRSQCRTWTTGHGGSVGCAWTCA